MNKTVNINLGGLLFHIDENAFLELRKYLDRLNKSFENEEGAEEIIADIEARIAELFNEFKDNDLQVINLKNVEDAIAIMGTPEELNDEEDQPKSETKKETFEQPRPRKQLFRDTSDAYISGVSSGLGHYFEVSVVWIRLAWILGVFFSGGSFILIYIVLRFIVPEAKTTADKLAMKGKSVNVNNIEQKIKEGLNSVADNVKNVYDKTNTEEFRSKSVKVFDKIGEVLGKFFKAFAAFIGALLMVGSILGIITLFTGFIGTNLGILDDKFFQYDSIGLFGVQSWLFSLFLFLISSIPLAFLFLLGLKITFKKVKRPTKTLKLSLLGVWILSIAGIIVLSILRKKEKAYAATSTITKTLPYTAQDTLFIKMRKNERFINDFDFESDYEIRETADNKKVLVSQNLKIYIETSKTETPYLEIQKIAKGSSYNAAMNKAEKIDYNFNINENELILDAYALANYNDNYANQKVKIVLSLPENITIFADRSTKAYNSRKKTEQYVTIKNKEHHYLKLQNDKATCNDCFEDEWNNEDDEINVDLEWNFDDEELEEKIESFIESRIEIDGDKEQIDFNGKNVDIKINENGIQIKTKEE